MTNTYLIIALIALMKSNRELAQQNRDYAEVLRTAMDRVVVLECRLLKLKEKGNENHKR